MKFIFTRRLYILTHRSTMNITKASTGNNVGGIFKLWQCSRLLNVDLLSIAKIYTHTPIV